MKEKKRNVHMNHSNEVEISHDEKNFLYTSNSGNSNYSSNIYSIKNLKGTIKNRNSNSNSSNSNSNSNSQANSNSNEKIEKMSNKNKVLHTKIINFIHIEHTDTNTIDKNKLPPLRNTYCSGIVSNQRMNLNDLLKIKKKGVVLPGLSELRKK